MFDAAITALRQALEQPECNQHPDAPHGFNRDASHSLGRYVCDCEGWEQEPVAWRYKIVDCFGRPVWTLKTPKTDTRVLESQPLYTSPPPQRKALTDEQIMEMYNHPRSDAEMIEFARAIEAAHGIGEKE